jgi:hypothetical protein
MENSERERKTKTRTQSEHYTYYHVPMVWHDCDFAMPIKTAKKVMESEGPIIILKVGCVFVDVREKNMKCMSSQL